MDPPGINGNIPADPDPADPDPPELQELLADGEDPDNLLPPDTLRWIKAALLGAPLEPLDDATRDAMIAEVFGRAR